MCVCTNIHLKREYARDRQTNRYALREREADLRYEIKDIHRCVCGWMGEWLCVCTYIHIKIEYAID